MKKICAILLAVMLMFTVCTTAFAEISPTAPVYEESDTDSGSSTPPSDTSPQTGDVFTLLSASTAFALAYAAVLAKKKASC